MKLQLNKKSFMRFTKTLIVAALASLCSVGMKAQCCGSSCEAEQLGYKPYPYWFIQAQGGINKVFSPGSKINPTASIGVGRMFSPIVGARLHFNGWETNNGFASSSDNYKFKYITSDADVLVNIFNIFSKNVYRPLNLYFVGGVGLSYAWDNGQFEGCKTSDDISNAWGPNQTPRQSLLSHNIRAGLLLDYNICKHWSVGLEADVNSLDDRFNSKFNNADDWMLTAQLSITYKFGFKAPCKHTPEPVVVTPEPEPVKVVEPVKEPEPVVEPAKEPLKEVIFYEIRENDPNPDPIIEKVVAWAKKYPEGKITISGYADRGTGNPTINVGYAQRRADAVYNILKAKGVPTSQMTANSFGDKVQPYAENDKNRCAIIVGTF